MRTQYRIFKTGKENVKVRYDYGMEKETKETKHLFIVSLKTREKNVIKLMPLVGL